MPNLIDVQRASYEAFLQMEVNPDARAQAGLQEVFRSVFPIDDFAGRGRLEFVQYELEEPKYDVEECIQRGLTFAAPLKVRLRLIVWDVDEDTGSRSVRDIKEQDVYMGDMPLMTENGTFIINGTERVIVSQMHRSPGRVLRPRQGQDALLGQVPLRRPRDPLSRLLARFRVRRQGHLLRPHRPQAEAAGLDPAARARQRADGGAARGAGRPGAGARRGPRHGRRGDPRRLLRPGLLHPRPQGLEPALRPGLLPRPQAVGAAGRRPLRRGGGRQGRQVDAARRPQDRRGRHHRGAGRPRRPPRPLRGRGSRRHQHRRDLGGGRRGADRAQARRHRAGGAGPAADPGHRPVGRALDAQHARGGQEHQPRRRADGHLPRDAPGRAADPGDGGDAVPRPVLRPASATTSRPSAG